MGNIFSSTDIRGYVGKTLTKEYVWNVGKGFAEWLPDNGDVVVMQSESANHDMVHALIEGILLQGRSAIDAGVGQHQDVIATIMDKKAAGGAVVEYEEAQNLAVITLFDARGVGVIDSSGLAEINQLVDAANFLPASAKGEVKAA
jgi:hypothetical protein